MNETNQTEQTERVGSVWYGTRSDPILALHPVLWYSDPEGNTGILETEGWGRGTEPESCVTAVLRTIGCVGGSAKLSRLRLIDDERQCIRHHGFDVPKARWGMVESTMRELLMGSLGGWTEVLAGQTGFHAPAYMTQIFGVLWATAGRPPVKVAHHLPKAPTKAAGVPRELTPFPFTDNRLLMQSERFGGLDKNPKDWMTDQKTYLDIQQDLKIAAESCPICGGRMYEADGFTWCANAANEESKPDLEHE